MASNLWPVERTDRLVLLWKQGFSAAEIARDIGEGLSRNAVIGRVYRLGLSKDDQAPSEELRVARKERHRDSLRRVRGVSKKKPAKPRFSGVKVLIHEAVSVLDSEIPLEQRRTLLTRADHECGWPVGDPQKPDFFYCGAPRLERYPYCASHCQRAGRAYGAC